MLSSSQALVRRELEAGTGAAISLAVDRSSIRAALRVWFSDLDEQHGPVAEIRPHGLKAHVVTLGYGRFAGATVRQVASAPMENVALARALVCSIRSDAAVLIDGSSPDAPWHADHGRFRIEAFLRHDSSADDEANIEATCRAIAVPLMAAMAELIGYDTLEVGDPDTQDALEGAVLRSLVKRRERNPRNRLLCLRIHGRCCVACGLNPELVYGEAGAIIEVHHVQPLSELDEPRAYDPRTDLVPLCPSCHRAVHTRRPAPLSIAELKALMSDQAAK